MTGTVTVELRPLLDLLVEVYGVADACERIAGSPPLLTATLIENADRVARSALGEGSPRAALLDAALQRSERLLAAA